MSFLQINHFLKETGPSKKHPKVSEQEPLPDSHVSMNRTFLLHASGMFLDLLLQACTLIFSRMIL
jgi:hypothetical protein